MNHRILLIFVAACFVAGCTTTKQYDGPGPFDKSADAGSQVTHAIVEASAFDKNVLLVFGANWCSDSRATVNLFATNSAISMILSDSFVVEKIDVGPRGSGRNAALIEQYHVTTNEGVPVLVVLDKSGRLLNDTRTERLTDEAHKQPGLIIEFLEEHLPVTEDSK